MSQHHLYLGVKALQIMAGWDRPLQGYFMHIELKDDDTKEDDVYLYNNLDDPQLAKTMGFSPTFAYFVEKAKSFGIDLPQPMIEEILRDELHNVGNRIVRWGADGVKYSDIERYGA